MAAPRKTLDHLDEGAVEVVYQALSRIDPGSLTYNQTPMKLKGLEDHLNAALQVVYNSAFEAGQMSRAGVAVTGGERAVGHVSDGGKTYDSSPIVKTNKGGRRKTPGGSIPYEDKGEFGCHRLEVTKAQLSVIRPHYEFTTSCFKGRQDHDVKGVYLDNDEVDHLKTMKRKGWKPSRASRNAADFKTKNPDASAKLKAKNRALIAKGLGISEAELDI
ncbi:hypothetical protein BKA64DRAFT_722419 [Cadophora sp. MPI-SDFR-AT-0126]|nr:hypothetical protein BKA64DRAFT_722419 [Leotiomycetes sp. MPI-SDFR-AT-0126]